MTGLALAPNGNRGQGDVAAQLNELVHLTDWVRYSLAGNLRWAPRLPRLLLLGRLGGPKAQCAGCVFMTPRKCGAAAR